MFTTSIMKKLSFNEEPLIFKYINKTHNFEKHIHNKNYMIGSFITGKSEFNIKGKQYQAEGDTICIIPPKIVHSCKSFNIKGKWQFLNFFPSINFLNSFASKLYGQELSIYFEANFIKNEFLAKKLKCIISSTLKKEKIPQEELIELLQILITNYAIFNKKVEDKNEKFEKLFNFLKKEEYDLKTLDFTKMANVMEMNPCYFHRLFSKNIGLTPQNFINSLRVLNATKLINNSTSLSEIAQDSGFYDQPYFTRQFKKYHGVTPKNYKKIV